MFCCAVCKVMFTGIYPESISTTQCGHVFHSQCILLCLNSSSKCPFCSLHVEKNKLVKLHFVIDSNWKDFAASLKYKTNASIINLDETMNISLNNEQFTESLDKSISELKIGNIIDSSNLNNISYTKLDTDSVIDLSSEVSFISNSFSIDDHKQNPHNLNAKVLLTTSLSGFTLSKTISDFLSILNTIIPNSTIQKRMLICESNLISAAVNENFTHAFIIHMHQGFPFELSLLNLLENIRQIFSLKSFQCCEYDEFIVKKINTPQLTIIKYNKLSKIQEFILNYFFEIFPKPLNSFGINDINVKFSDDGKQIKFKYNAAGLSFDLLPRGCNNICYNNL